MEGPGAADDPMVVEPAEARQDPIVTSGESDEGVLLDSDLDDDDDASAHHDPLYDEGADDADEAYVYQHLRSGGAVATTTTTLVPRTNKATAPTAVVQKARNSDAVLSCPCCLTILCMDCQQHERYTHQYRAMFVMNIRVRWDCMLQATANGGGVVPYIPPPVSVVARVPAAAGPIPIEADHDTGQAAADATTTTPAIYYTVCCASCQTTVASLDMTDEVYHFYGCLASA